MSGYATTKAEREQLRIFQAHRIVVGHCPECMAPMAIFNDRETWPPALCECGWGGGTTDLLNHVRYESAGLLMRETVLRWTGRPTAHVRDETDHDLDAHIAETRQQERLRDSDGD